MSKFEQVQRRKALERLKDKQETHKLKEEFKEQLRRLKKDFSK